MSKKNKNKPPLPLDNIDDLFIHVTTKEKGATGFLDGGFKMDKSKEAIFLNFNITVKHKANIIIFYLSTLKVINTNSIIASMDRIKFHEKALPVKSLASNSLDGIFNSLLKNCNFTPNQATPQTLEGAILAHIVSKINPPLVSTLEIDFIKKALHHTMFKNKPNGLDIERFWAQYAPVFESLKQKAVLEFNINSLPQEPPAFKV